MMILLRKLQFESIEDWLLLEKALVLKQEAIKLKEAEVDHRVNGDRPTVREDPAVELQDHNAARGASRASFEGMESYAGIAELDTQMQETKGVSSRRLYMFKCVMVLTDCVF